MPTSLNQAAQHRAAVNWAGAFGPLMGSGVVIAIALARAIAPVSALTEALGSQPSILGLCRLLLFLQIPLVWLFIETTAWRRRADQRRGRKILAAQALALGVAVMAWQFAGH